MNKENVDLWVKALRSGEYKQCKHYLSLDDGYCCLGVACEVYQKYGPGDLEKETYYDYRGKVTTYNNENAGLPNKVSDWLGIRRGQSLANGEGPISLNDSGTHTFDMIADKIEKYGFKENVYA